MNDEITRKKRKMWVVILFFVSFLIIAYGYLFGMYSVRYEDMDGGINSVVRDGITEFVEGTTNRGKMGYSGGGVSKVVLCDYEAGIQYRCFAYVIQAQRWNLWLYKGQHTNPYFKLREDFTEIHTGSEKWKFDPRIDYEKHPDKMNMAYLEVFYMDPGGEYISIWRHPDYDQIVERLGPVEEPKIIFYYGKH